MDPLRHAFLLRITGGLLEQFCPQPRRGRAPGIAQTLADLRLQPRKLGSVRSLQDRIVHHHLAGPIPGQGVDSEFSAARGDEQRIDRPQVVVDVGERGADREGPPLGLQVSSNHRIDHARLR